jgi:hypothetical protein
VFRSVEVLRGVIVCEFWVVERCEMVGLLRGVFVCEKVGVLRVYCV